MKDIKLVSLDLDGTLLDTDRRIPEENIRILQEAAGRGIEIVIATGSPLGLMPHELLQEIPVAYAITANGSAVYDYRTRECLYERTIPELCGREICSFLADKEVHTDFFIGGNAYVPRRCKDMIERLNVTKARKAYLRKNRIWLENQRDLDDRLPDGIQKITMNFFPDNEGRLVDYILVKETFERDERLLVTTGVKDNIELTSAGVDKGEALLYLLKQIGMERDNVIAFGDSKNDISIIKMAGIGVAMGNSMEELIKCADEVTLSNDACGVASTLKKYL